MARRTGERTAEPGKEGAAPLYVAPLTEWQRLLHALFLIAGGLGLAASVAFGLTLTQAARAASVGIVIVAVPALVISLARAARPWRRDYQPLPPDATILSRAPLSRRGWLFTGSAIVPLFVVGTVAGGLRGLALVAGCALGGPGVASLQNLLGLNKAPDSDSQVFVRVRPGWWSRGSYYQG
jgi:hypothetical protein